MAGLEKLVGADLLHVDGLRVGSGRVRFVTDRGVLVVYHSQDCCESVEIEDIAGTPNELLGEIISANVETNEKTGRYGGEETWTFYRIQTNKRIRRDPVVRIFERILLDQSGPALGRVREEKK